LLVIVIAVVAVVAVSIILSAVLYFLVSELVAPGGGPPGFQLGPPVTVDNRTTIRVILVDSERPLGAFTVVLWEQGGPVATLAPLRNGTNGPLTFVDSDGSHTLTAGDRFLVDVIAGMEYELLIEWPDGSTGVSWSA
jgi:hypothetical protein